MRAAQSNQRRKEFLKLAFPPRSLPIDLVLDRCDVDYASGNDDLAGSPALHRRIFRPLLKRQVKSGQRAAFERFQDGRAVVGVPSDLFFVSNLRDRHSELLTSVSSGFRRSIPIREDSRKIGKVGEERVAVYRRSIGSVTEVHGPLASDRHLAAVEQITQLQYMPLRNRHQPR